MSTGLLRHSASIHKGLTSSPFPTSDLLTRHTILSDKIWTEVKSSLNASIVGFPTPTFNGTDQYGSKEDTIFTANNTIYFRCKIPDFNHLNGIIGRGTTPYKYIRIDNTTTMLVETDTDSDGGNFNFDALSVNTIYDFVITQDGSKLWTLYINNLPVDTFTSTNSDLTYNTIARSKFGDYFNGTMIKFIHYDKLFSPTEIANEDYKSPENYTTLLHYEFADRFNSEISIDLSSNLNHLTWNGTAGIYSYDSDGNSYGLDNGVQVFNTTLDESGTRVIVPYKSNGTVLYDIALESTQDILGTTYYLISNNPSIENGYNICPALFDFDPTNSTNSKLDNFDGSNTIIYSANRRSLPEYNASEPYRIDGEYLPYNLLNDFFNSGHTEKVFSKAILDENNRVIGITQLFNYSSQQLGGNLQKILGFCNLLSLLFYFFINSPIQYDWLINYSTQIIW